MEAATEVAGYQEQALAIQYVVDGRGHTYIPDVAVVFCDGRALIVEIKPRFHMGLTRNLVKWAALLGGVARMAGDLIGDGRATVSDVLFERHDDVFCERLLASLRTGSLSYWEYRRGVGHERSVGELAAAVGAGVVS